MLELNKLAVLAPELAGITQITKRAASPFFKMLGETVFGYYRWPLSAKMYSFAKI
jgi:hypothetical protein